MEEEEEKEEKEEEKEEKEKEEEEEEEKEEEEEEEEKEEKEEEKEQTALEDPLSHSSFLPPSTHPARPKKTLLPPPLFLSGRSFRFLAFSTPHLMGEPCSLSLPLLYRST